MPMTDAKARNAKPKNKQFKLFDTDGLFLLVSLPGVSGGALNTGLGVRKNYCLLALTPRWVCLRPESGAMQHGNKLRTISIRVRHLNGR